MYILFYLLKFPSTPVLILFQSSATPQQSFVTSDRTRTCIHPSVSRLPPDLCLFFNPTFGSSRHCFSSCQIMHITHSPAVGATLPFVHQAIWSGRQDSNLRPLVPKTSVLPTELLPDNCCFFIILRHSCPENSFRLLSRLTFTEGLHGSVHYHCGIAIAF